VEEPVAVGGARISFRPEYVEDVPVDEGDLVGLERIAGPAP